MKFAGLDYSMTSPAICIFDDKNSPFSYTSCKFYYLTQNKKYDIVTSNIWGKYFDYSTENDRYDKISTFFIDLILEADVDHVFIENYSMGSRGRVFNIAENTGIFKYRLWKHGKTCEAIAPTVIKKFATGKGNADKQKMQDAFQSETNVDLKFELKMTEKQWNPSSDIIDAYWICKYALHTIKESM